MMKKINVTISLLSILIIACIVGLSYYAYYSINYLDKHTTSGYGTIKSCFAVTEEGNPDNIYTTAIQYRGKTYYFNGYNLYNKCRYHIGDKVECAITVTEYKFKEPVININGIDIIRR